MGLIYLLFITAAVQAYDYNQGNCVLKISNFHEICYTIMMLMENHKIYISP